MGCGDHDAATAPKEPHGVGELWSGSVAVQEHNLETVGNHDRCAKFSEMTRAVASVVSDRAGKASGLFLTQDVIGQTLSTFSDGSVVDGIGSNRIHPTTPAPGTKRNNGPKDVVEFFPVRSLDMGDELGAVFGVPSLAEPVGDVFGRRFGDMTLGLCQLDGVEVGIHKFLP